MGLLSFLVSNRFILAIWLLPASLVYDVFWYLRSQFILWLGSAPKKHKERVEHVQKQVGEVALDWHCCSLTWLSIRLLNGG